MKVNILTVPKMRASNEERAALRPIGRNVDKYQEFLAELEELAIHADALGYNSFSTAEHHFHTEGLEPMPNSLLFFAKLAALTKQMVYMPLSMVLTTHDPIRVAEDIALFDHMFPGRLAVSFARGYQKRWVQTLTQRERVVAGPADKEADALNREIYDEHLEIVLKAFSEDAFNYDGKHYQVPYPYTGIRDWPGEEITRLYGADGEIDEDGAIRKIGVVPAPFTKPHPDLVVPFSSSEKTIQDSARRGFISFTTESHRDKFRAQCERFRDAIRATGYDARLGERIGAVRLVVIGDSYEEALDMGARTFGWDFYNYFAKFGLMELLRTEEDDPNKNVELRDEYAVAERMVQLNRALLGTPDDVRRQLDDLHGIHGGDGALDWLSWEFYPQGNLPLDDQKRQLELFAEKVWPDFK